MSTLKDLTPELLTHLYSVELKAENELARLFGTSQVQIGRLRKKWGIPALSKTDRIDKCLPPISEQLSDLLVGSLLGDGGMSAGSCDKTARYAEHHSAKQLGYLQWKASIFGLYAKAIRKADKTDKDTGRFYPGHRLDTVMCSQFRSYYDWFYPEPDRKKEFPTDLYKRINPFILAVWFMDDGSVGTVHGHPSIAFGLSEFSLENALRALRQLKLHPVVDGEIGEDRSIRFPGDLDLFRSIVSPHIIPSMSYKTPADFSASLRHMQHLNSQQLDLEKAVSMYNGGVPLSGVSSAFGVGLSTLRRKFYKAGVCFRAPGPIKDRIYDATTAHEMLEQYDPKLWATLDKEKQEKWVEDIVKILQQIPFPGDNEYRVFDPQVEKASLLKTQLALTEENLIQPNSKVGGAFCGSFFPNRYRARYKNAFSAFEAWCDQDLLERAVRFQLRYGDPVVPHRVLRALMLQYRTPSVFKPAIAHFLYRHFCSPGDTVWDPCSGYGGRLFGAVGARVHYIGTDVDPATVSGNLKLNEALGGDAKVFLHPAETFTPPPVSFVFTSPPYFDREQYSTGADQSWVKYSTCESWLQGFLQPVIRTAFKVLVPGKVLALNITDLKAGRVRHPLVAETEAIAKAEGFVQEPSLFMPLSRLNRTKEEAQEPILVFRKPDPVL